MPLHIGDPAPPITGTDVVNNQPWALQDHAGKTVLLVCSGITWCGPCKKEAPSLEAVWNQLSGVTIPPFTMAIISGGQGGVEEDPGALQNAINDFGITFPVVPGVSYWPQYKIEGVPTLYCLHWNDQSNQHEVGAVHIGASGTFEEITEEILNFLYGCGVTKIIYQGGYLAATYLMLFGGVSTDAGGWGITPGGKPIPIPPWDPLRPLSRAGSDALVGLAVAEMGGRLHDPELRNRIRQAGIQVAKASITRLDEASKAVTPGVTVGGAVSTLAPAPAEGKSR